MNKGKIAFSLIIFAFLASCHSAKKVTNSTISKAKKDSSAILVKTDSSKKIIDSAALAQNIWDQYNKPQSYTTFSGKLGVAIQSINLDQTVNANLRIAKDSLIWISLTGPFGIEGARVKILRDSIILINKLNKSIEEHNLLYIQKLLQQPVEFQDVQHLLMGKALISDGKIASYQYNQDGSWVFHIKKGTMLNMVTLWPATNAISKNILTDQKQPTRTCEVLYEDFQNTSFGKLPKKIEISVNGKDKIKVALSYKQYDFNQTLDFPFNIPTNYSVH